MMVQEMYQRISVSFNTDRALREAEQALQANGFSNIETVVQPAVSDEFQELKPKPGILKVAIATGVVGTIIGGMMATMALFVPNFSSLTAHPKALLTLVPMTGAALGAAGGAMIAFLSGSEPNPDAPAQSSRSTPPYQLVVETVSDRVSDATKIVKQKGGQLL